MATPPSVLSPGLPDEIAGISTSSRASTTGQAAESSQSFSTGLKGAMDQARNGTGAVEAVPSTPTPPKDAPASPSNPNPSQKKEAPPQQQQPAKKEHQVQPKEKQDFAALKRDAEAWQKHQKEDAPRLQQEIQQAKAEAEATKKEAADAKAQFEAIQKEYEGAKGQFTENQTWRMAFEHEQTPEYLEKVAKPFDEAHEYCANAAKTYGFDLDAGWQACAELDPLQRDQVIRGVVRSARIKGEDGEMRPLDADEAQDAKVHLKEISTRLAQVASKDREMATHAEGLRNQINAKRQNMTAEQTAQQQREAEAASKEAQALAKNFFKGVFEDADPDVKKAVDSALKSPFVDTPMSRAMSALLPDLAIALNTQNARLSKELAEAKTTIEQIGGARGNGLDRPSGAAEVVAPVADFATGLRGAMAQAGIGQRS